MEYITEFIAERGYEPSYQQIARAIGVSSKAGIAKHISALENQGLLLRSRENGSFSLNLHPKSPISDLVSEVPWLEIPESAGGNEPNDDPIFISKAIVEDLSTKPIHAFRVFDDSMINNQICEDDIALVEERKFARDRDCVVAIVAGEEAVLHSYHRKGGEIELRPANEDYESIILGADKIEIIAVMRGLIRSRI
ncbi:MAG: hypothetical protein HKN25_06800 [Pyrinomonadaceae bacterium]|nr:hypothetical protein [Pyrinomonadaceae bacterium]